MYNHNQSKTISKGHKGLNSINSQINPIHIWKMLHPSTAEYTPFSSAHETFTKMDCTYTEP